MRLAGVGYPMPLSQRHDAREGGWPQKRSMCPGSLPDRTLLRSRWDRRTNELLGGGGAEVTDPEREDRIVRTVGGGRARHCRGCERPTTSTIVHVLRPAPSPTERSPRPSGMTRRLWQFGHREQHGGVLCGMQGVPRLGDDQQPTGRRRRRTCRAAGSGNARSPVQPVGARKSAVGSELRVR